MPTVSVKRNLLFKKIGQEFSDEEFDKICFEFGIELDEVVDSDAKNVEYKIDIPANRYDLLCVEGISTALAVFLNKKEASRFIRFDPPAPVVTHVKSSTKCIRPYLVTAVLRGLKITPEVYESIIDLQEKLHFNICRKRTFVAIGIHDLDTLSPPFVYSADPPQDISFQPLSQDKVFRADDLMEHYQKDTHLKPFLHIIKDEPLYPIIRDSKGIVLSLPPIINGNHSKVTNSTKNLFIECTATDLTKANVVLDTLVTMLSEHCAQPFVTEGTQVVYEDTGETVLYPSLRYKTEHVDIQLANQTVGIELEGDMMAKGLSRMGLKSKVDPESPGKISVEIPPTRHDIIHQCDIMEDVAISYGYSNITPRVPPTPTIASQYPLNNLTSKLREGIAQAGFTEALTFSLCSVEDECDKLRHPQSEKEPTLARISNPKTQDFQVARNSLLPGLLKTLHANKNIPLPIKVFEISDVVVLDPTTDTGAKNNRHFCAVNYNKSHGFEVIHGLQDRFMQLLEVKFGQGYFVRAANDPTYFPGRCAEVVIRTKNGEKVIGKMGVLDPEVTKNFDLNLLCSSVEISIEDFL